MDTSAIMDQLVQLNTARIDGKPSARKEMLVAAQALVTSLQTPSEFISCIAQSEPARYACLRTAAELELFEELEQGGRNGVNVESLAKMATTSTALIRRIMKHLAATNVVSEVVEDVFARTDLSYHLTLPKYKGGIYYGYDACGPPLWKLPQYFKEEGYSEPFGTDDGPFQFGHDTQMSLYPWLNANPTTFQHFEHYMAGYRESRTPWFTPGFYPVQERLIDEFTSNSPAQDQPDTSTKFLIDLGGGKGHDLLALSSQFPNLPGELVLEDQPETIALVQPPLPSHIQAIAHDIFTPQPPSYQGAKAYFLHSVLHNFSDQDCITLLKNLKPALAPGYSKVIVHDLIVPDKDAHWSSTALDLLMLAICSAKERTEADFQRLFDAAGLVVTGVWVYEQGTEGVIEAVLPV